MSTDSPSSEYEYDVFFSYSRKDADVVRSVRDRLESDGVRVWIDYIEIQPGDSIPEKIEEGLSLCRVLVCCLSANSSKSDWARLERYSRLVDDPVNRNRQCIPVTLDDTPVEGLLSQVHRVDLSADRFGPEYLKLLKACLPKDRAPVSEMGKQVKLAFDVMKEVKAKADKIFADGLRHDPKTARTTERGHATEDRSVVKIHNVMTNLSRSGFPILFASDDRREFGKTEGADYFWVADEVDGGRELSRGVPLFTSTIALVSRNWDVMLGMTYIPWTGELFHAQADHGAYLSPRGEDEESKEWPLRVSSTEVEKATVAFEFPNKRHKSFSTDMQTMGAIISGVQHTRGMSLGSHGLAYVAKGCFDAYIDLSHTSYFHNLAAGMLLVREAKGHIENLGTQTHPQLVACTPRMKDFLEKTMREEER